MAYNDTKAPGYKIKSDDWNAFVAAFENITTGHDHDGTNSKQVDSANVIVTPAGTYITSDNVQGALEELDTAIHAENIWDRASTTVTLANSGDTLSLSGPVVITPDAGTLTHSGATSLTITSTNGTVIVEGVTFTGSALTGATGNISMWTNDESYIKLTSLSSSATGLTYTNTTGVFTLTAGYVIPTTTQETNWGTAYTNRVDTWTLPLSITGNTVSISQAGVATDGYLSTTDWNTFNNKEPAVTKGNLTETTSAVLTISGGTNCVIGSGTTIQVTQASSGTNGYLSSTDWSTFNGKQDALTTGNLTAASGAISLDQTRQVIGGAAVISHSTADGYIHLPSGGTDHQILTNNGTNGTGEWNTATLDGGALGSITTISMNNQLTNTLADGTAPMVITSTTKVSNLNVDRVDDTHKTAAISASGALSITANTYALHSTADTAITIAHSTADGYIHLPSGGSSNQLLKNNGSGTGAWGTVTENAGALGLITTIGMSGDLTMSGDTVNITHSGTTSLTIASTSGTVAVESVTFTGDAVTGCSNVTSTKFTSTELEYTGASITIDCIKTDGASTVYILNSDGSHVANLSVEGDATVSGGDLYVGTTAQVGALYLYDGSDHNIKITSPAIAASWVMTLPPDDGDNGQVLYTDGSGNCDWKDISGTVPASTTQYSIMIADAAGSWLEDTAFKVNAGSITTAVSATFIVADTNNKVGLTVTNNDVTNNKNAIDIVMADGNTGCYLGLTCGASKGIDMNVNPQSSVFMDIGADVFSVGTFIDIAFDTAEELTGALIGLNMDLATNVTHGSQAIDGIIITLPATDQATSSAITITSAATAGNMITDGTATWSFDHKLAGFASISGTTLTDGTASLTAGAWTSITTLGMSNKLSNSCSTDAHFLLTGDPTIDKFATDGEFGYTGSQLLMCDGSQLVDALPERDRRFIKSANLIHYWKFDEKVAATAYDYGSGAYNLSKGGDPTFANGIVGSSTVLNGTDEYWTTSTITTWNDDTAGTFSVWVKLDDLGAAAAVWCFGDTDGDAYLGMYIDTSGAVQVVEREGGTNQWTMDTADSTISAGKWFNITVTHDGVSPKLFVNGVDKTIIGTATDLTKWTSDVITANADNFTLGVLNYNSSPASYFDGSIDEVIYWNAALTDEEVANLYNSYNGSEGCFASNLSVAQSNTSTMMTNARDAVDSANWINLWSFNEHSTVTATDDKGSDDLTGNNIDTFGVGIIGSAPHFDGVDQFFNTNTLTTWEDDTAGSINAWAYIDDTSAGTELIWGFASKGASTNSFLILYQSSNGNTYLQCQIDGVDKYTAHVLSPSTGAWHMFTVTHNGTAPIIYVDGIAVELSWDTDTDKTPWIDAITAGGLTNPCDEFGIGGVTYNGAANYFWDGYIDEVRYYSDALSTSEVGQLYRSYQPSTLSFNSAYGTVGFLEIKAYGNNLRGIRVETYGNACGYYQQDYGSISYPGFRMYKDSGSVRTGVGTSAWMSIYMATATNTGDLVNISNAGTAGVCLGVIQDNASCTSNAVTIQNDGTGYGLQITQTGTIPTARGALDVYTTANTTTSIFVRNDGTISSQYRGLLYLYNSAACVNQAYAGTIVIQEGNSSTTWPAISITHEGDAGGTSGIIHIIDNNASNDNAIYHSSGAKLTHAGTWTNASSRSLKHDIKEADYDSVYADFEKLPVSTFVYNADSKNNKQCIGLIAEEAPDYVANHDHTGVDGVSMGGFALAVLKKQDVMIKELKAEINALKNGGVAE